LEGLLSAPKRLFKQKTLIIKSPQGQAVLLEKRLQAFFYDREKTCRFFKTCPFFFSYSNFFSQAPRKRNKSLKCPINPATFDFGITFIISCKASVQFFALSFVRSIWLN